MFKQNETEQDSEDDKKLKMFRKKQELSDSLSSATKANTIMRSGGYDHLEGPDFDNIHEAIARKYRGERMEIDFLKWIEHASFLIEIKGKKVYIDPFRIRGPLPKADIIFLTHTHMDHLNEDDIKKLETPKTRFVAPKETASKLGGRNILVVEPGKSYEIEGISFSTVPAYNVSKEFHPRSNGWVGYIIDIDGKKVYHAGDTDAIEEMKNVKADIALLPIGGHYTMSIDEAVKATAMIKAQVFVPMHYKALLGADGAKKAEEEFKKKVKNSVILEQIQEPYYSFQ